jgi:UDP-N-acetylmuramoylalanine--D-glutamate ligase
VQPAGLAGRRALVMGLGSFGGGLGAARYLGSLGARVQVTDLRSERELAGSLAKLASGFPGELIGATLGRHDEQDFRQADVVVANPAVRPDHPLLVVARSAGARVTSEIELVLEALDARIACVTGTQGKSSTCNTLTNLLLGAGMRATVGGNIGGSLLESLGRFAREDVVVLELSSYQLEALSEPGRLGARVEAVAITNVLADHLERHGDEAGYARAKARILELVAERGDALLPGDDPRFSAWGPGSGRRVDFHAAPPPRSGQGRLFHDGQHFLLDDEVLGRVADLALPGAFQRDNTCMALGLARLLGAPAAALARAIPTLRGLPHRLEDLGLCAGRRVHDNGVSTTPDSTIAALLSLAPGVTWIGGGRSKGLDWSGLGQLARERVRAAISFGEAAREIEHSMARHGVEAHATRTLEDAVRLAFERAPPGGVILFSPACSSFDDYVNFQARALAFRRALPAADGGAP